MKKQRIILFDIDGTLLLTGGAGTAGLEKAFLELFGIENASDGLQPHGMTDRLIIREIALKHLGRPISEEELATISRSYLNHFAVEIQRAPRFRVLAGVVELVRELSVREDTALGIQTGNFEHSARLKLETGKLAQFFSFGGYGSDSHDRGEIVQTAIARARQLYDLCAEEVEDRIVVIGDAPQDILAGAAAGARTIAVATGASSEAQLAALGPDHVLADLSDTRAVLSLLE